MLRVPAGLNFGFGFVRVSLFQQFSGSGLSGFSFKVRVLGFSGTRPGTNDDSDEDLFSRKKIPEKKPEKSLFSGFSSSDSDDDLFASKPKTPNAAIEKSVIGASKATTSKMSNLFDDSSDEDDLFSNLGQKK